MGGGGTNHLICLMIFSFTGCLLDRAWPGASLGGGGGSRGCQGGLGVSGEGVL